MTSGGFRFERFHLDPLDRRLRRDDVPVELNARYLDALVLLVREHGKLVSKNRFLEDVWGGVPVTDEALTQCIRTLRRLLGDDAVRPRFIETVHKHGYRFVAPVERLDDVPALSMPMRPRSAPAPVPSYSWQQALRLGGAGTIGGGVAGIVGGLLYGVIGALQPPQAGVGAASLILVLVCLTALIGLLGGAGVAFGIAAASFPCGRPGRRSIAGGAAGGLVIGAMAKLLGLDLFTLLFGQSPGDITGPFEGALLGAGVGCGAWLASRDDGAAPLGRHIALAALMNGAAGVLIALSGGRLMAGSLDLLAQRFPTSRLRLNGIGSLFGEAGFGPVTQIVASSLEAALFGVGVVVALIIARRRMSEGDGPSPPSPSNQRSPEFRQD